MRNQDVFTDTQTYTVADAFATLLAALTASSGVPIEGGQGGARGVAAVVSAPSGQTLTGGNIRCAVYMPVGKTVIDNELPKPTYRWMRHTQLDFAVGTAVRDWPTGDQEALTGAGRIIWLPDAVTLSGGTTADVTTIARRQQHG